VHNSPNAEFNLIKIVVAGITGCLGSASVGLTDALARARCAIAHATSEDAPFRLLAASSDGAAIVDGFGRPFEVAASFDEISSATPFSREVFSRMS